MSALSDLLVVIGMFALRLGVPLVITLGLGYLLKRLDRRWAEQARLERQADEQSMPERAIRQPAAARPGAGMDLPGRQLPVIVPIVAKEPGVVADLRPCWEVRGCRPESLSRCSARQHPERPCWEARWMAEGQLPELCPDCDIFNRLPVM